MRKFSILFIFLVCSNYMFGQQPVITNTDELINYVESNQSNIRGERYVNVNGSPFLTDGFVASKANVGDQWIDAELRYNIYEDNFEMLKGDKTIIIDPNTVDLKEVIQEGKHFILTSYNRGGGWMKGYFQLISPGKKSLLLKDKIQLIRPKAEEAYKGAQPARFQKGADSYWLLDQSGKAEKLPTRKRKLPEAFGDHVKQIEKYMKTNHLSAKKDEDLIKITEYYNSLD